jgi:hypothetical protein
MTDTVVSLHAFLVSLDVFVDLVGATVNISLEFGPFPNKEAASKWVDEIDAVHAERHSLESALAEEIFDTHGLPTRPYIDTHLSIPFIAQSPLVRKTKDRLLAPGNPKEVEAQLGAYALRAALERLEYACHLLDTEKV